jgi:tRNA A37 threonylcarbamoyladenosine synthetase subunit TsaC/SUA5/YrdC
MVGKALLNLDEVARILDPEFEPEAAVERHVEELMQRKMLRSASPSNVLFSAIEVKEFAERLPDRLNKVLDALAEGQLTLNIQGIDESQLMRGVQKLANRVALGTVVAALVIAGSISLLSPAHARLLGEPIASLVLFAMAIAIALWMVMGIVLSDLPQYRAGGRASRRSLMRGSRR